MVDGFIVPDLPVEEAADYRKAAKELWLGHDFSCCAIHLKRAVNQNSRCFIRFPLFGFAFGVTGAKTTVEDSTVQLIKRVLPFTAGKIPLAVGFGISKPEHVKRIIAAGADGAIVGSAFINIIQKNKPNTC